jgi:CRISPR type III-B/RAMP module-associated protein Cmr5
VSALELARAKFALEKIHAVKNAVDHDRYKSELQDLPTRLHSAGLGQTIASLLASADHGNPPKDVPRIVIYRWLQEWLRKPPIGYPADHALIECIVGALPPGVKTASYMAASRETRALATWLKKFAEAFIEPKGQTNVEPRV